MYKLVVSLLLLSVVLSADTAFVLTNACACNKITVEGACAGALQFGGACVWDASKECKFVATTAPANPECNKILDQTACNTSLKTCFFTVTDATKTPVVGTCAPAKCSDFTTALTCQARNSGKLTCQMNTAATPVCVAVTACANVTAVGTCSSYTFGTTQCVANADNSACVNLTACSQLTETPCSSKRSATMSCQWNSTAATPVCAAVTSCSSVSADNISSCNTYSFATELCSQTAEKTCSGVKECKDLKVTSSTALLCSASNRCMAKKEECVPLSCGDLAIGDCTTYNTVNTSMPLCYKNKEDCESCFGSINSVAFAVIAIVLALFF